MQWVRTRCTVTVLAVCLRIFQRLRDQIDRSALKIFPEVLVPTQFPALVPGQEANDIVRNPFSGEGRSREVAEVVNPQFLNADGLGDPPEPLS